MKKLLVFSLFFLAFFNFLPLAHSQEVFDNCDEIGNWKTISSGVIKADTSDKVEGTASLKMNYSAGWDVLFYKDGLWNFSSNPVIKFKFKANNQLPANFRFRIITPPWKGFSYNIHNQITVGKWVNVSVDLRLPESAEIPDLNSVQRVEFSCWDEYIPTNGSFNLDLMEILPGPSLPLEAILQPNGSNFILINGTSLNLKVNVRGGVPPYYYEWFIDGIKQQEAQQTFKYIASKVGVYNVWVRVIDSNNSFVNTSVVSIKVIEEMILPEPRMLHTEGSQLYDDKGKKVHLHGVHSTNFGDSSTGWFIGGSFRNWDENAVKKNLKTLENWGSNFLYLSGICFDRLVNNSRDSTDGPNTTNIGLRDAIKKLLELAYQYGIYIGIGIDNYVCSANEYVWYWAPAHLNVWIEGWLNISREFRAYPNVLYGMNAEPALQEEEMNAYFNAIVQALQAIRKDGDEHIFFYHEDYCSYPVRFDKPATQGGEMIRKLHEHNISNIIYSGHIYRWHGTFGDNPHEFTGAGPSSNADGVYTYEEIVDALTYWGYKKILEEYKVPIIMGEGGPAKKVAIQLPNTWEKEITCYRNLLQVLNEWGIGYAGFWWREPGTEGPVFSPFIFGDQEDFIPNEWGQVLIEAQTETISEKLIDKHNKPVSANISFDHVNTTTDLEGKYNLTIPIGFYDVLFNIPNFFIKNFWIKLLEVRILSSEYNKLTHVTNYPENKSISLIFNITNNQTILVYSKEKPRRVLKNSTVLTEYNSISDLISNYGWFYNQTEKILYVKFNESIG